MTSRLNNRLHKGLALLLLVCLSWASTGCWDRRPVEEQGIAIVLGADVNRQNPKLLDLTVGIPLFDESKQSFARINTASGPSFGEAVDAWQAGSALEFAAGKMRLLLFGEEMARLGLPGFFNYLEVARADNNALVAVTRGRAEDLLRGKLVETEHIGTNTANLLQLHRKLALTCAPDVNVLVTAFVAPGIDPILPLLELSVGKDIVSLEGSALFKDLTMVGELDRRETELLLALRNKVNHITYTPLLGVTEEMLEPPPQLRITSPRAKIAPTLQDGLLTVAVEFSASYILRNYHTHVNMIELQNTEKLSRDLESELSLAFQQVLAKLQELQTDPIGVGKKFRVKNFQSFDEDAFRQLWADATLQVNVHLRFDRPGTLTRTD
ncbi:MAG: Ger(x)C family spore germination protein [Bacillota bacterium]|jgi:Ger(x)C family germination protein